METRRKAGPAVPSRGPIVPRRYGLGHGWQPPLLVRLIDVNAVRVAEGDTRLASTKREMIDHGKPETRRRLHD